MNKRERYLFFMATGEQYCALAYTFAEAIEMVANEVGNEENIFQITKLDYEELEQEA